ncbi:MAG: delta-aminolevulinic acid dehydratase [Rickettsiaceae bacterium]|jgi:porphobilinogen synthase|nr:delta-aminolevulinic acid dehydratase [Rickettsiaceae bacterium]
MPFFVIEGQNQKEPISSLPDQFRFSIDLLIEEVKKARDLGIKAIMLFPAIDAKLKTKDGSEALNPNNLICQAVRAIKRGIPEIGVICDVALDPYTSHGHDGLISADNYVLNDETIEVLCKQALTGAQAGCDIVAPSDMMDGRVGEIRKYLDENGFHQVGIMSYAVKYASNFYGPFRNAVGSDKNLMKSDKKNYQMDFRNSLEALREINLDIGEGADMLIIKPGLPYLDIVAKAKTISNLPIISYQVSGEYAMLKLAASQGLINFEEALYETLIAFKRAGASAIISYGAMEAIEKLELSKN